MSFNANDIVLFIVVCFISVLKICFSGLSQSQVHDNLMLLLFVAQAKWSGYEPPRQQCKIRQVDAWGKKTHQFSTVSRHWLDVLFVPVAAISEKISSYMLWHFRAMQCRLFLITSCSSTSLAASSWSTGRNVGAQMWCSPSANLTKTRFHQRNMSAWSMGLPFCQRSSVATTAWQVRSNNGQPSTRIFCNWKQVISTRRLCEGELHGRKKHIKLPDSVYVRNMLEIRIDLDAAKKKLN